MPCSPLESKGDGTLARAAPAPLPAATGRPRARGAHAGPRRARVLRPGLPALAAGAHDDARARSRPGARALTGGRLPHRPARARALEGARRRHGRDARASGNAARRAADRVDWQLACGLQLSLLRPQLVVTDTGAPRARAPAAGLAAQPWRALERVRRVERRGGSRSSCATRRARRGSCSAASTRRAQTGRPRADAARRRRGPRAGRRAGCASGAHRPRPRSPSRRPAAGRARAARSGGSSLELAGAAASASCRSRGARPAARRSTARSSRRSRPAAELAGPDRSRGGARREGRPRDRNARHVHARAHARGPRALERDRRGPARGRRARASSRSAAEGYGGRLEASGSLALAASARTDVELRAGGFDPLVLARALAP